MTKFDTLLQPIKINVKNRTFLVSIDVMSRDTNIPQNEGIEIVCKAYENFYRDNLFPHITYRKCLDSSSKKISSTSLESTTIPTNPWNNNGHKDSSFLRQHFHNIY